jgi:NADH-quinone oxidoreductase subunit F
MGKIKTLKQLEDFQDSLVKKRDPNKLCITVCGGTGCRAYAWEELIRAFEAEIEKQGLKEKIDIRITGCHGFCERGPLVVTHPQRIFYQQVRASDVAEIISETLLNNKVVERLLYIDPVKNEKAIHEDEVNFYKKQQRLIFGNNGKIDPTDITDYIALGGYTGLGKVLTSMSPEQVIEEIIRSGLRGRGGGGFPTGRKWLYCRQAKGDTRYVICNADEGDPGAYMDRSLLEGNPHSVLEGMIIGAYAIGAGEGYVYVRNEYPLAVKHIKIAIEQAEGYGFLGENILDSGFSFSVKINRGGGAFVCGESTALMASLEGRVGEPRAKHIHTVESGLWERPTNLNNVETWANVPLIIAKGAEWYSKIGTKESKGTKIFSLVGKINNTGLVEVPMGITLREIIYDIGGGIPGGKKFKAVQTGGPSGGCIPESMLDLPVDFEELTKVGSMMGSGGMIVMDEDTCMVDVAKYFLSFLQDESCGKCTSCREGIKRMLEILTRITQGKGKEGDIELLEELSEVVKETSLCALGQTAPNPVLTSIRYFRDEYEAHIRDKKCPARVCRDLITYTIDEEKCTGCMRCLKECPQQAVVGERKKSHRILQEKCIKCGICYEACRFDAVKVE